MHAVYIFLIDSPDAPETSPVEAALSHIEHYIALYGDENNWWELLLVILPDGAVFEDRGKKEDFAEITRASDPLEAANRFALQCVAYDVHLENLPDGSPEAQAEAITLHTLKKIRAYTEELVAKNTNTPAHTAWKLYQLARTLHHLLYSHDLPFIYPVSPYEYRAFDLRNGKETAVALVDIHT